MTEFLSVYSTTRHVIDQIVVRRALTFRLDERDNAHTQSKTSQLRGLQLGHSTGALRGAQFAPVRKGYVNLADVWRVE